MILVMSEVHRFFSQWRVLAFCLYLNKTCLCSYLESYSILNSFLCGSRAWKSQTTPGRARPRHRTSPAIPLLMQSFKNFIPCPKCHQWNRSSSPPYVSSGNPSAKCFLVSLFLNSISSQIFIGQHSAKDLKALSSLAISRILTLFL